MFLTFAPLVSLLGLFPVCDARPASYAVWAADSGIARGQGNGLLADGSATVSYEHGEFQWGLRLLYELTGNKTYFDYIQAGVDNIVFPNGTIHGDYEWVEQWTDSGGTRLGLSKLGRGSTKRQQTRSAGSLTASRALRRPILAQADFKLMFDNTLQSATAPNNTGLMYHGYDFSHTAVWASPRPWSFSGSLGPCSSRGYTSDPRFMLGWYAMALVDVLEMAPPNSGALKPTLLNILNVLAPKIRDAADPTSGVWWLVITEPGRTRNYFESSGAAMYIYSLLKAVRLGYVEDADGSIVAAMKKAYNYAVQNWVVPNSNGTMDWKKHGSCWWFIFVGSLDTTGDFNYYVSQSVPLNDLKGLAAFLLASLEFEKL
ncbi:glycoside hydrolase family 105 protein [Mycena olivaceomarginata]|nr:glycoside hydrolase family 105 protein [Mycena olivaceomarginata]